MHVVAHQGQPAIAGQHGAGDVGSGVAQQEQGRLSDFVAGGEAAQRQAPGEPFHLFRRDEPGNTFGAFHGAGAEAVHPNPLRPPFEGEVADQRLDPGLGGGGVRLAPAGADGLAGGDRDQRGAGTVQPG